MLNERISDLVNTLEKDVRDREFELDQERDDIKKVKITIAKLKKSLKRLG